jgi:transposase
MTAPKPAPPRPGERTELDRLRAENALLRAERDILLRVATGYALDAERARLRP